jgi:hypothetical protein
MKLKSLKFFSLVVFVLASFISVSSHSTSVIAKTNKCPQINGIYQRKSDKLVMRIQQSTCDINASIPPTRNNFNHIIDGRWSSENDGFDITMVRTNTVDGCTTELTGTLYKKRKNIRLTLDGSDGKCDVPADYNEDFVWVSLR